MLSLHDIVTMIEGGGNLSLLLCVYFMWKNNDRMLKVETLLGLIASKHGIAGFDLLKAEHDK